MDKVLLDESKREEIETIPSEILKEYILYARTYVHPKI